MSEKSEESDKTKTALRTDLAVADLPAVVEEVNRLHRVYLSTARTTIQIAMECGAVLAKPSPCSREQTPNDHFPSHSVERREVLRRPTIVGMCITATQLTPKETND
jgi:hypothetical protein